MVINDKTERQYINGLLNFVLVLHFENIFYFTLNVCK